VGAVPWCPWDPRGAVPRAALAAGAFSVDGAAAVFDRLGLAPPVFVEAAPPLLAALDAGPLTLDALASRVGRPTTEVRVELGRWEIEGRVRRRAGRYERC
jgi:predicted Rossmann fold nucleotide-binding protein DprA/Smf involved in DNA uptake